MLIKIQGVLIHRICICSSINKVNVISEKAHTKKLGWEIIDEFQFNNNTYSAHFDL